MRLAEAAGVGQQTIASAETGKLTRLTTMIAIADALELPICALGGTPCDTGVLHARANELESRAGELRRDVERIAAQPARGGRGTQGVQRVNLTQSSNR